VNTNEQYSLDNWLDTLYITIDEYDQFTVRTLLDAWSIYHGIWPDETAELHIIDSEGTSHVFHIDDPISDEWNTLVPGDHNEEVEEYEEVEEDIPSEDEKPSEDIPTEDKPDEDKPNETPVLSLVDTILSGTFEGKIDLTITGTDGLFEKGTLVVNASVADSPPETPLPPSPVQEKEEATD
jgi:hypothetical protein